MRGYVLVAHGGPEVLHLRETATPAPAPGEVVVDVEVAGVNFADTMIRRGEYLRHQPLSLGPGSEAVGRVSACGDGVDMQPGRRVAAWVEAGGAYAEQVVVPAHRVYGVPEDLPAATIAALFIQGTTAYYAVHRFGRLAEGESLLVHAAAGGVGGLAAQLGALAGAHVIGTASTEPKRESARANGATTLLDSRAPDELVEGVRWATGGRGVDVVVDGVGGSLFAPSLRALAVGGRYVIAGAASQQPAMMDARRLLVRNQWVGGFILAHITAEDPGEPQRALGHLCALVRDGQLSPRYETMPLEDAPEAHRLIEQRGVVGKIVLEVQR